MKKRETDRSFQPLPAQAGSVFTVLLAGIAIAGALSVVLYQTVSGPMSSMVRVTNNNAAKSQMQSVSSIVIMDAVNQAATGDCDGDGSVEPREWRVGAYGPTGGGLVPSGIGAPLTDPWGTEYGYCVWDVGTDNDPAIDNGCGVTTARLKGTDDPTGAGSAASKMTVAIISAGPDRQFQTTCAAFVDDNTAVLTEGGDDVVRGYVYAEAAAATSSLWTLKPADDTKAVIGKSLEIGNTGNLGTVPSDVSGTYSDGIVNAAAVVTKGAIIAGGAVRLAPDSVVSSCAAGNMGDLRYNATDKLIEVCDGAGNWPAAGGGVPKLSDIAAADAANTIDSLNYQQVWNWSTLGGSSATALTIAVTSTDEVDENAALLVSNTKPAISLDPGGNSVASLRATASGADATAVIGEASGGGGAGLYGFASQLYGVLGVDADNGAGVYGRGLGASSTALQAYAGDPAGYALYATGANSSFTGLVTVSGDNADVAINASFDQGAIILPQGDTDVLTCDGDTRGTVRYNTTTNKIEYCDNQPAWVEAVARGSIDALTDGISDEVNNVFLGTGAGTANTTGTGNVAVGIDAYKNATTYHGNAAVGYGAMRYCCGGIGYIGTNIFGDTGVGYLALQGSTTVANNSGIFNTGLGYMAVQGKTSGILNIGAGMGAVNTTTTASYNTGFGMYAVSSSLTGGQNTGFGMYTIHTSSGKIGSTAAGYQALYYADSTTASVITYNTALGAYALRGSTTSANNTGVNNTAVGHSTLIANTTGYGNVGMGYLTLTTNTSGVLNTAIAGLSGFRQNQSGSNNVVLGLQAYNSATAQSGNTVVGVNAMYYGYSGGSGTPYNTAIGSSALMGSSTAANNSGTNNTGAGYLAMGAFTSGSNNVALGRQSLSALTSGSDNVVVGNSAAGNVLGGKATALGLGALNSPRGKSQNTAIGYYALYYGDSTTATGDVYNTATGYAALRGSGTASANTGTLNTATGYYAMQLFTTGSDNAALGAYALQNNTVGIRNTAVGRDALITNVGMQETLAVGYRSMYYAYTAASGVTYNTAVGAYSLRGSTTAGNNSGAANTGIGHESMLSFTTGGNNAALGRQTLYSMTTGVENTAVGHQAEYSATSSSRNVAVGYQAVYYAAQKHESTGVGYYTYNCGGIQNGSVSTYNAALGAYAMQGNCGSGAVTGTGNTAVGSYSQSTLYQQGSNNTGFGAYANADLREGTGTTALGYWANKSNLSWINSTYVGYFAGAYTHPNTSAISYNTAMGAYALRFDTSNIYSNSGTYNTAFGHGSLISLITSRYNTAIGVSVMRGLLYNTSDNSVGIGYQPLYTMRNSSGQSVAIGERAAYTLFDSVPNVTAIGYYAGRLSNVSQFTAVGSEALAAQTSGTQNVAVGRQALLSLNTGGYNTAVGYQSMRTGTTAGSSTAIGASSLYSAQTGTSGAVALGYESLYSQNSRNNNTAIGYRAMYYADSTTTTTASANTAAGAYALRGGTTASANTGIYNTALGHSVLMNVTSGGNSATGGNVGIGYSAGTVTTTGHANTLIGYNAQASAAGTNNETVIGANAVGGGTNTFTLGDTNIATITAQVTSITAISDKRQKKDIQDADLGLEFIEALHPVSYRLKTSTGRQERLRYGFIAQEIEQALGPDKAAIIENQPAEKGFALLERENDEARTYRMNYFELFAPIVKAVQALAGKLNLLEQVADLARRVTSLVAQDNAQEQQLMELTRTVKELRLELHDLRRAKSL